jgi:CRP/FNR family transcriptional regulator, cyclic AMP receptor protein
MNIQEKIELDPVTYLATPGEGRRILHFKSKHAFFTQGSDADSVFYIQTGRATLNIASKKGKEATVTLLAAGDFVGEESLIGEGQIHKATACAVSACVTMKIGRAEMQRALKEEQGFSEFFLKVMLTRGIRAQADLIDRLFNSSEKRLARALLTLAEYGSSGEPEDLLPLISQETLAVMIGTTRSRVSFFMNRFRKLGYVKYKYKGRVQVHRSFLKKFLRVQLSEENSSRPKLLDLPPSAARPANRAMIARAVLSNRSAWIGS